MARSFVSASSQGLQSSTLSLSSFNQMSISFWLKWTTFGTDDHLALEYSPNANNNAGSFFIDPNASDVPGTSFTCLWISSAGTGTRSVMARPSAGVWHHYVFEIDGTQTGNGPIPTVYVDGVSQSLTYTQGNATAASLGNYALNFMCRNQASLFGDGSMADVAIWAASSGNRSGALLTQGEATALANGARPFTIRPTSFVYWWPIDGLQSPEPDLGGTAQNATLTNAPAIAPGPPVMQLTPRWSRNFPNVAAAAQTFQPAWAMRNRIVVEGIGI